MEFNLAQVAEAIEAAIPDHTAVIWRDARRSYAELGERTRRLANFLVDRGLADARPSDGRAPWESRQAHLALYMYNCPQYLELSLIHI